MSIESEEKKEKGVIFLPGFFAHIWDPPEEDNEDQFATEREVRNLDWVWEDVLPRGGISMLSAAPKTGKTVFVTNLGVAHARGNCNFFGRHLHQGIVTMVILEGSSDEVIKTVKVLSKGQLLPIKVRTLHPQSVEHSKFELKKIIEKDTPSLLIIDTLWKLVRAKDVADYATMATGMEMIDRLAKEYGTHIMVTHHSKKKSHGDAGDALGSTAILGGVDTGLYMELWGKSRRIWSTQRHGTDLEPICVLINKETKEIFPGELGEEDKRSILAVVEKLKNATAYQIIEQCKIRKAVIFTILNELCGNGTLKKSGRGSKGNPYVYHL